MPIRKLAARIEQDLSHLHWQGRIYGLSCEQLEQRFQQLAAGYRQVVLAEHLDQLEQLLARETARLDQAAV